MDNKITPTYTAAKTPAQRKAMLQALCTDTYGNEWGNRLYDSFFAWLEDTDFFTAPASTRYHGAYAGGLFDHSMNVAKVLLALTRQYGMLVWQRSEAPLIVGILHDVTKIGCYTAVQDMNPIKQELEVSYIYNRDHERLSVIHGLDSVLLAMKHTELTTEEAFCIRWHMGAYETESWTEYDKAIQTCPNVLWTHTADMVASKLLERRPKP